MKVMVMIMRRAIRMMMIRMRMIRMRVIKIRMRVMCSRGWLPWAGVSAP